MEFIFFEFDSILKLLLIDFSFLFIVSSTIALTVSAFGVLCLWHMTQRHRCRRRHCRRLLLLFWIYCVACYIRVFGAHALSADTIIFPVVWGFSLCLASIPKCRRKFIRHAKLFIHWHETIKHDSLRFVLVCWARAPTHTQIGVCSPIVPFCRHFLIPNSAAAFARPISIHFAAFKTDGACDGV